jgi:hypothetical protein
VAADTAAADTVTKVNQVVSKQQRPRSQERGLFLASTKNPCHSEPGESPVRNLLFAGKVREERGFGKGTTSLVP